MSRSDPLPGVCRGTIPMLALACGVMVANIYLCQPLLADIARGFGVPAQLAAMVSVATQIGYTLGILFVVPLADSAAPVKLVKRMLVATVAGLLVAATAPGLGILLGASLIIASSCVVAQILIPLATTLGGIELRGRIVSSLTTGLILGILLSRTFSGIAAQYSGSWRTSYLLEAALVAGLYFVLPGFLPARPAPGQGIGYFPLLRSLLPLLKKRELQVSITLSFFTFAAFSAVWATLSFHLATPAFGLGSAAAGLFGLWGAPGALLAPLAGRLSDRWGPARVNAISLVSLGCCFTAATLWGATSLAALVLTVNLLDFGQQSGQVANQARIFGLGPEIRGRLNTLYMVMTFAGGALGALAGGLAWAHHGWNGVCVLGAGLVTAAALVLACLGISARSPQKAAALLK